MTDWGVHLINIMLWAMGPDHPKNVSSTGGIFVLDDNRETPDTQVTTYEFPHYTMIWEHRAGSNNGPYNKDWAILFNGSEGTLNHRCYGLLALRSRRGPHGGHSLHGSCQR